MSVRADEPAEVAAANPRTKVAVASSGLGHVARGIETWALDTAEALAAAGCEAHLFAAGAAGARGVPVSVLPCARRGDRAARLLARLAPPGTWRWGWQSPYGWEQFTFWLRLAPALRRGAFDLLHVQDPLLAYWCRAWRRRGWLRTREILAHGTEEPAAFLAEFPCVQHLAPWHLEQLRTTTRGAHPLWRAIPNFVDTARFRPAVDAAERTAARRALGLPPDAWVLGSAAAVKRDHKRVDYLIREFAAALPALGHRDARLVIAGASHSDAPALARLAQTLAGDRVVILLDLPREEMPAFYRALDAFALASLFEMMPIALLEAQASGLPAVVHGHPVLAWMCGAEDAPHGGETIDMAAEGALTGWLGAAEPARLAALGRGGRQRAVALFAKDVVVRQYLAYYRDVLDGTRAGAERGAGGAI